VNAVDYLLKPFDRTRVEQAVERVRGRLAGSTNGSLPESQIESLLRLLKRPQGASRTPQPAKLIVQAQNRLLLIDQAEICFAAIDEGVIRVATQSFEACPSAARWRNCSTCSTPPSSGALIAALW